MFEREYMVLAHLNGTHGGHSHIIKASGGGLIKQSPGTISVECTS